MSISAWVLPCCGLGAWPLLPAPQHRADGPVGSAGFAWGSAVAVVVGIRRHRPANRRPWYLIATAFLAIGAGDVLLLASPVRDLADLCFLATYVSLTVALLRLVRARSQGRDIPALLDALVVTIGLGVVSWQFLMVPYARDPSLTLDQKLTSVLLPLADVVVLAVLCDSGAAEGSGRRLLAAGLSIVSLLMADTTLAASLETANDAGYIARAAPSTPCSWCSPLGRGGGAAPVDGRRATAGAPAAPGAPAGGWPCSACGDPRPGRADGRVLRGRPTRCPWSRREHRHVPPDRRRTQRLTREVTVQDERRRLLAGSCRPPRTSAPGSPTTSNDGPCSAGGAQLRHLPRPKRSATCWPVSGEGLMGDLRAPTRSWRGSRRASARRHVVLRHLMSALGRLCSKPGPGRGPGRARTAVGRSTGSPSTSSSSSTGAWLPSWRRSSTGSCRSR